MAFLYLKRNYALYLNFVFRMRTIEISTRFKLRVDRFRHITLSGSCK